MNPAEDGRKLLCDYVPETYFEDIILKILQTQPRIERQDLWAKCTAIVAEDSRVCMHRALINLLVAKRIQQFKEPRLFFSL